MPVISDFWNRQQIVFRRAVERGATPAEVAAEIGVSRNAAIGYAHRNNLIWASARKPLPPRPERRPPVEFPRHGHCVWPLGDPGEDGFSWCGGQAEIGRAYCARHHRRAYRKMREAVE